MKPFKFLSRYTIVGGGENVGVICLNRRNFSQWVVRYQRGGPRSFYGDYEFLPGVRFVPITYVENLRGYRFDHIIELECADINPQYRDIIHLSRYSL